VGDVTFPAGDGPTPISPLVKAGNMPDHISKFEIVAEGGKKALKYVTVANWGPGFDLPNSVFGFREGDKITIEGKAEGAAIDLSLNVDQGGANTPAGGATNKITAAGAFTLEATLTAADVTKIRGNEQKVIRFEDRKGGTTVTITQILIEGKRPSNLATLAAPVITLTGTTVSWTAVAGAGGYKVLADGTKEVTSLIDETSYNLALSSLDPGSYKITVIALGVAGSSKDSAPSNEVNFTKAAPVVKKVTFTAGMLTTDSAQGSATVVSNGAGYTFTADGASASWGGGYSAFRFDLEKPLSSFIKINFKYTGVAGDFDYKNIFLLVSSSAAPAGYVGAQDDDDLHFGKVATGDASKGTLSLSITIDATKAATVSGTNLYFALYVQMDDSNKTSSYTITDVEFVE